MPLDILRKYAIIIDTRANLDGEQPNLIAENGADVVASHKNDKKQAHECLRLQQVAYKNVQKRCLEHAGSSVTL